MGKTVEKKGQTRPEFSNLMHHFSDAHNQDQAVLPSVLDSVTLSQKAGRWCVTHSQLGKLEHSSIFQALRSPAAEKLNQHCPNFLAVEPLTLTPKATHKTHFEK